MVQPVRFKDLDQNLMILNQIRNSVNIYYYNCLFWILSVARNVLVFFFLISKQFFDKKNLIPIKKCIGTL